MQTVLIRPPGIVWLTIHRTRASVYLRICRYGLTMSSNDRDSQPPPEPGTHDAGALQTRVMKQVWNHSRDNMFLIRAEKNEFYMVDANMAERTSFELVTPMPRNQPLSEFLPGRVYHNVAAHYRRCIALKDTIHYEEQEDITSHDGTVRYWSTSLSPVLSADGDVEYLFGISRDITGLRLAREQAEKARETKSALITGISRQMARPLSSIEESVQQLAQCQDPEQHSRLLADIDGAVRFLRHQADDLRDYAELDQGLQLHSEPFSVRDVCQQTRDLLYDELQRRQLTFRTDIDAAIPPLVCGDGPRLQQLLLNLTVNAIRFTQHGGIILSATVDQRRGPDHQLRFAIPGTGDGIHHEDLPQLFRPFSRIRAASAADNDSTVQGTAQDTGLGLAICQDLVNAKHGNIRVSSEPGKGAVFEVLLSYPAHFS